MFHRLVGQEDAVRLLDLETQEKLHEAVSGGLLHPQPAGRKGKGFRVADLVIYRLAEVLRGIGVEREKSLRYSEAILRGRLDRNHPNPVDWVENEAQELFCLVCDGQLARIFLRNKDDSREVDVGAVKPILFPTTICEVNVFRAIRPIVIKACQLLGAQ